MNYRRSLIKLTLGYLCIIMLVSLLFSFVLYEVAYTPLQRRIDTGRNFVQQEARFPHGRVIIQQDAIREVKREVAFLLVYINLGILILAGMISYLLARQQLMPLARALKLQGRFTSDAAHELRTPLTAMRAEIEVALRGGSISSGEARDLLESNLEEIARLELLSGTLLKLAGYEQDTGRERQVLSLGSVAAEAMKRVERQAKAGKMELSLEVVRDVQVRGDRTSLVEMLIIILDNSINYSEPGRAVDILVTSERDSALIRVTDQGYGIREEDLEHVFDRFYRGCMPEAREKVEGYGLGLSIASRIAGMHHGSIDIDSSPGQGTTVSVLLPPGKPD